MSTAAEGDITAALRAAVVDAAARQGHLYVQGGGSKLHLNGRHCTGEVLSCAAHRGIVSYQPAEQVITARAGTPILELIEATQAHGQQMGFEPALLHGRATIGGTLACGLSGPARPWRGSVRDAVLGIRLINGLGEELRFGGEVMKNVAGYDVSRLQAGALGTLGLISEVSLRLLPAPAASLTLQAQRSAQEALDEMRRIAGSALPLSGASWAKDTLFLRFAGSAAALQECRRRLPGYAEVDGEHWTVLREWQHPNFAPGRECWRFDIAPAAPAAAVPGTFLIDWAGACRYSRDPLTVDAAEALAAASGGHARRLGGGASEAPASATPPAALQQLQRRLKLALDPQGVFNRGRLHSWM